MLRKDTFRRHRLERLEERMVLDASMLRITEFMASNDGSLLDADGDESDWIEIHNPSSQVVNLSGMYLTDDSDELDKWQFPSGSSIAPGEFLVVFASDKDGIVGGSELHTNFRLSAGGEFLGLVDSSGITVIDAFAPEFPEQEDDISYGIATISTGVATTLLDDGAAATAHVPTDESLGDSWQTIGFDDSAWTISGPTGLGFEDAPGDAINFTDEIQTTVPSGTTSLLVRVPFELSSLGGLGYLSLDMRYDDGFVAYINGVEVASANAPDDLAFDSTAGGSHADGLAEQFVSFDISSAIPHLQVGANVLAIHALNHNATSADMLISPRLVAYAAHAVSPESVGFFAQPTPGWGNLSETTLGFVEAPTISVPHGFYQSEQTVELATDTDGAIVVYTTDGSTPAVDGNLNVTNGTIYSTPLSILSTTVLRARAFKQDFTPSSTAASSYLFLDDIIYQSPNGELPTPAWPESGVNGKELNYGIDPDILALYGEQAVKDALASVATFSLSIDLEHLFDPDTGIYVNAENHGRDWEREVSVEFIDELNGEGFFENAGIRIRGGASRHDFNPKNSFRLYFRGEYGNSKLEFPFFGDEGTDEFDVLDLRTAQSFSWASHTSIGATQSTFLREVFARDTQADMGHETTRSRYHHLYINGVYWGLYQTQERVEETFAEQYFGGDETDYDIIKAETEVGGTAASEGNDAAWRQLFDYGEALYADPETNADLYWTMQGLNSDGTRNEELPVLLDVDNLVDYMMIVFYTGGYDIALSLIGQNIYSKNWFAAYNRVSAEEGFQFFIHDNEASMGTGQNGLHQTQYIDRTGPYHTSTESDYKQSNPQFLHQDLLVHPEYRQRFVDRVQKHFFNGGALTDEELASRLLKRKLEVEPAIIAEAARWGDSKTEVPHDKSTWDTEVAWLFDEYIPNRSVFVLGRLRGDDLHRNFEAPELSQHGGLVPTDYELSISSSVGTIYYSLDGQTDPRLIGGDVNPSAEVMEYTGPITLTQDTSIMVRLLHPNGSWSGLVEADFTTIDSPGDFNNDGTVDAADYTVWRNNLGAPNEAALHHRGDGQNGVDLGDYQIWKSFFGTHYVTPAAAASSGGSTLAMAAPVETPKLVGAPVVGLRSNSTVDSKNESTMGERVPPESGYDQALLLLAQSEQPPTESRFEPANRDEDAEDITLASLEIAIGELE